jgi:hypothetical protein
MIRHCLKCLLSQCLKKVINREKGGQVYAILELNGPVKPEPSTKHESYPMAIESVNKENKVTLHLLTDRQNWFDVFEDFETGEIVSKKDKRMYSLLLVYL